MAAISHDLASLHLDGDGDAENESSLPKQRDLRSPSRAKNRHLKQKQKYYAYRAVHPSWVGQPYYTLVPVSDKPVGKNKKKKDKKSGQKSENVIIEQEQIALKALLRRSTWDLQSLLSDATFHAAAEVRKATKSAEASLQEKLSPDGKAVDTIEAPKTLAFLNKSFAQNNLICSLRPKNAANAPDIPENLRFKLKIVKWTRRDNFDHKEFFCGGPDRRHSKSRRQREKRAEKWTISGLGRRERQRQANALDMASAAVVPSEVVAAPKPASPPIARGSTPAAANDNDGNDDDTATAAAAAAVDRSRKLSLAIVIERYEESVMSSPRSTAVTSDTPTDSDFVDEYQPSQLGHSHHEHPDHDAVDGGDDEDDYDDDGDDDDDESSQAMLTPTSTVSSSDQILTLADLLASTELVILPRFRRDDDMDSFRTDDISDLGDQDALFDLEWEIETT